MLIDCTRCGEQFDTDRDHPAGRHADTWRCPKCGASHDRHDHLEEQGGAETEAIADGGAVSIEAGEETIQVHIHVHRE
jgi:rubredoxin